MSINLVATVVVVVMNHGGDYDDDAGGDDSDSNALPFSLPNILTYIY